MRVKSRSRKPFRFIPRSDNLEDRSLLSVFTVVNTFDSPSSPVPGSLRAAVEQANLNPGFDVINFDPGVSGTISLTGGQLTSTDDLQINGPGASVVSVSGLNQSRVIEGKNSFLRIDGLTLTGGLADTGAAVLQDGGILLMNGDQVIGNRSTGTSGGAVTTNVAFATLNGVSFLNNKADFNGGAVFNGDHSTMNLNACFLANNVALYGGGGIYNFTQTSTLNVNNSTFIGNSCGVAGGAVYNAAGTFNSSFTTYLGNNSANYAGAIMNDTGAKATVSNSNIQFNTAQQIGGAILSRSTLTVQNSLVQHNQAVVDGGGIAYHVGTLTLAGANVISDNSPNDVTVTSAI